jgi:hypothetical protein
VDSVGAIEVRIEQLRNAQAIRGRPDGGGSVGRNIIALTTFLDRQRGMIHDYVIRKYIELKFSGIVDDIVTRTRLRVDDRMSQVVPEAVNKLAAAYENLRTQNDEDWANAVHSCRRVLEDLADKLLPPTAPRAVTDGKDTTTIELGPKHYRNRLVTWVSDQSASATFAGVVGSSIKFVSDRLEALFEAANKGTHGSVSRYDAERYVIYTYMILGDILSLMPEGRG